MPVDKLLSSRRTRTFDPIGDLTEKLSQITSSKAFSDQKIAQYALSTESLDQNVEQSLVSTYNNIESTIKTIAQEFNVSLESYQVEAGTIGSIFGTDPKASLSLKPRMPRNDAIVHMPSVADGYLDRQGIAVEAYDERENRNSQLYTIIYNLLASRQDDFGETFFPTIVVNPTEVGVTLSVRLFYVYNDFKRAANGALANYGRKNIIRAYADATILRNELTRVVPVLRTSGSATDINTDKFLPAPMVTPWTEDLGTTITVTTSALKVDTKIDLIGISQTDELLNSGIMGPSDNLDTFIKLASIYVQLSDGTNTAIVHIPTDQLPSATFTYAPQGNTRRMLLTMDTNSIVLSGMTEVASGTLPSGLSTAFTAGSKVLANLNINGSVILDKGDAIINRGQLSAVAVRNSAGQVIDGGALTDPTSINAVVGNAVVLGYTLTAYRANSNIRQRGQLLDNQTEYRIITVPYRSPMSVIMPAAGAGDDNLALQTLINSTGIRISNEAVTSLLKTQTALSSYNAVPDLVGNLPELDSIGYFYVKPYYAENPVNLSTTVDSLKSHERIKDIRAALVEKIRFYANDMYLKTEYKAAAAVLTGNALFKPTVIVGTDPVLYNYIMADGDLRTLGDTFEVKVVSTLDTRVTGKIFISFGVFDSSRNTAINPLNFGNMLYSPETVVRMPVSRDGQVSMELIVAPRFVHINNLPAMAVLDVTGLPDVVAKVSVNTHTV